MNEVVRSGVAAAHGLAPDAANFLTGSTVEEVEASALALADLFATHAEGGAAGRAAISAS